jgi:TRAP-type C4-dicarboxylate transport system permease small subunit
MNMQRVIALLIIVIPGVMAGYGIKLMRDMLFGVSASFIPALWLQFIVGFIMFAIGLSFVAGFIFHRDRKRNNVQKRFQNNEGDK